MQELFSAYNVQMNYNERMKEIASKRRALFRELHDEQKLSFVEIARRFSISPQRARQIYDGKRRDI